MSLYKRGNIWWISFTTPLGQRIRESGNTTDRRKASKFLDKRKAELWQMDLLCKRPEKTWNEAAVLWLNETTHKATQIRDREILNWLEPYLGQKSLGEITRQLIAEVSEAKVQDTSPSTANRYLALVRSILRRARDEWEWIDRIPKVRLYSVRTRRIRWITRDQAELLLTYLPSHQSAMARFALATGLRQRNVRLLEWSQVELNQRLAWIHPDQAKARKAIGVPLNEEALSVLRRCLGQHERYVFTYRGKPVIQVNTNAWRIAVKKAGIADFRWHDLRHTWASWHAQAGTPLNALQEMGGWASAEMVRRYAHLSITHLRDHAERIVVKAPNKNVRGTNLAHPSLMLVTK